MSALRNLGFSWDETWQKLNQRRDQLERGENENDEMTALSEEDLQKVSQIVRSSLNDDRRASIRRVEADFFGKRYANNHDGAKYKILANDNL